MQRGHGIDGRHDGVLVHKLLASYAHLRTGAGSQWAPRFVACVRSERAVRAAARPATAALASDGVPPARPPHPSLSKDPT